MNSTLQKYLNFQAIYQHKVGDKDRGHIWVLFLVCIFLSFSSSAQSTREKLSINHEWRFYKGDPLGVEGIFYDTRPEVIDRNNIKVADARPEEIGMGSSDEGLRRWILPSGNDFIKEVSKRHEIPKEKNFSDVPFVQSSFKDSNWELINLPHDWAIKGPFYVGNNPIVGGGMGRLPVQGIGWYRKKLKFSSADRGKSIYIDIDGAMSYAMVWFNGKLIGGWPYGYNSFRLDLTPYIKFDDENQLAIRLDNPNYSARWYPGAGIYRNVWITKVNPVHVTHWGTFVHTKNVSDSSATIDLSVEVENKLNKDQNIQIVSVIYPLSEQFKRVENKAVELPSASLNILPRKKSKVTSSVTINNPQLWGPLPQQQPNLYVAVSKLYSNGRIVDEYETQFGIRSLEFNPDKGLFVNGEYIRIQGVNQHHDLGALGTAFNVRAAERQLEILREMGCNAIRMAHNPPAPELLDLTDRMGFLVIDEIYDSWERGKTPHDFHLIFNDWYEADLRAFVRRDKNHPSIIAWSYGNEVGEQYTGEEGALLSQKLLDIVKDEDSTRPAIASMNYAKPEMPFPSVMDLISLNYQGEGIRDAPAYQHLKGIKTPPLYPAFHEKFPGKMIISSETASTLSTRGTYVFPVFDGISAPVSDSTGGDPKNEAVSSFELYTSQFGASPDKVFRMLDKHPYVSGEFVWSGFDYLGEPTPYYSARSSYSGIIDLAGFKKDRFYLYQSQWRPNYKMAHILPHWNWPERIGQITPVHVFTSGDEGELFLNNVSLGRKKKELTEYRLRWDNVIYEPGELKVVVYKDGKPWAEDVVRTTDKANKITLKADRQVIHSDGLDLSYITVELRDKNNNLVQDADNLIQFSIDGPGEIIATDNGDPADMTPFSEKNRRAFSGLALVIVRSYKNEVGKIKVKASSNDLESGLIEIESR